MGEACFFCGEPATLLCDAPLGLVKGGEHNGQPVTTLEAMIATPHTCDAPMCRACGKAVGHVCGKDHDTIDHCPLHAGSVERGGVLTPEEIATARRALHAQFRRNRIRVTARGGEGT